MVRLSFELYSAMLNSSTAFQWGDLPENAKIVDVGGGIGATSVLLAQNFAKPKFIVQDLPKVGSGAKAVSNCVYISHISLSCPFPVLGERSTCSGGFWENCLPTSRFLHCSTSDRCGYFSSSAGSSSTAVYCFPCLHNFYIRSCITGATLTC